MGNSKKLLKNLILGAKTPSPVKKEQSNKTKIRWSLSKASSCINPADDSDEVDDETERKENNRGSSSEPGCESSSTNEKLQSEITVEKPSNNNEEFRPSSMNVYHTDREDSIDDNDISYNEGDENRQKEQAATTIQAAFRGFLCRRAFEYVSNDLKQQQVIDPAEQTTESDVSSMGKEDGHMDGLDMNSKCMQAVIKVQAHVRSRQVQMSEEGKAILRHIQEKRKLRANNLKIQDEWDHSTATYDELQAKIQSRQEAAIRREKALAYASLQQLRICTPKKNQTMGWTWLERWMAARPTEGSGEVIQNNYADGDEQEMPQYGKIKRKSGSTIKVPCPARAMPYDSSSTKLTSPAKSSLSRIQCKTDSAVQDPPSVKKAIAKCNDSKVEGYDPLSIKKAIAKCNDSKIEGYDPPSIKKAIAKCNDSKIEVKTNVSVEKECKEDTELYEESCGSNAISIGSPKADSSNSSFDSKLVKGAMKSFRSDSIRLYSPHYMSTTHSANAKAQNVSDAKLS